MFSIGSLIACLIMVPVVYQRVSTIRQELRSSMARFEDISNDAWSEIQLARRMVPKERQTRQPGDRCRKSLHCYYY